jgi:hypothetical protein
MFLTWVIFIPGMVGACRKTPYIGRLVFGWRTPYRKTCNRRSAMYRSQQPKGRCTWVWQPGGMRKMYETLRKGRWKRLPFLF